MWRSALTALAVLSAMLVSATGATAATPAPAGPVRGHVYLVDCTSGTNGDGRTTPWNSLSSVTRHGPFAPGDRILVKRGTTCTGRVQLAGSGVAGAPIVLGAYGHGSRPILAGGGTKSGTAVVMLENQQYWTVQDLHVTNYGKSLRSTQAYRSGVRVVNDGIGRLSGIVIQRLWVEKVVSTNVFSAEDSRNWGGIVALTYQGPMANSGFDGLVIRDNAVIHVGRTGIMVTNRAWPAGADRDARITANRVDWARSDSIVLRGSIAGRIDHNLSRNGADLWPCPECSAVNDSWHASIAIWTAQSRGVLIDHNEVSGMHAKGGDGEAFDADIDTKGVVIEYNYAHDNGGGGALLCGSADAVVRFNVFEDNLKSTFAFIGNFPAKNTRIYNNSVYQSTRSDAGIVRYFNGASGSGIRFFNNLVYSYATGYYSWPAAVWSRANTYVGTHRAGEPHGQGYSWADPGLRAPGTGAAGVRSLNGYRPTSSRRLGTGVAIPSGVTLDFFGQRIDPKHPPRGAVR